MKEVMENQNTLINVTYNDLVGSKNLEYDLFNSNGDLLYTKGQEIDSGFLLRLRYVQVYRKEQDILANDQSTYINLDLNKLYLSKYNMDMLNSTLKQKKGILFISGNRDSGKTITAYSILKSFKSSNRISTLESSIKYQMPEIDQNQENSNNSVQFANKLAEIIEKKPEIILVRDIKEKIVGEVAYKAALSDYRILATMYADNVFQTLSNLLESGVDRSIIALATNAIIAQKLVRKICDNCKEKYKLTSKEIKKLFIWDEITEVNFYEGKGCTKCNNTGYSGRIPVQEMLIFDDDLRSLIVHNASIQEIRKYIDNKNFKDMKYDGIKKVLRGLTTIKEINRAFK